MALIGIKKPEIITDTSSKFMPSRRSFLIGAGIAAALAPSIVRSASLMNLRGEPLRLDDFLRCDGRIIGVHEDPGAFALIEGETEGQRAALIARGVTWVEVRRRYGGSVEDGTFALPDFTPFKQFFGEEVAFDLDRRGDLYMTNEVTGEKEKL